MEEIETTECPSDLDFLCNTIEAFIIFSSKRSLRLVTNWGLPRRILPNIFLAL